MKKNRLFWVFLSLAILFFAPSGWSESEGLLNKLLAPGPLMKGHSHLEGTKCLQCHDAGKGVPDIRCIDCHKEIKPFVTAKKGLHGLATQSCRECHADHKGREFNSMVVDEKTFKHGDMTGYSLDGKHGDLKCVECHKEKRVGKAIRQSETRYFGKATTCIACHKKDDVHFFKGDFAKKDCVSCHSLKAWDVDVKFNHEKDTKFKLEGEHNNLDCAYCHVTDRARKISVYKWSGLKQKQCLSCHQEFHKTNLSPKFQGGKCVTCHTQDVWKIPKFDHQITKYKLRGKHAETTCTECHKQTPQILNAKEPKNLHWVGLKTDCLSCHKEPHKFGTFKSKNIKNPNSCVECHNESNWKKNLKFDHNESTRYPIDGKHTELKCEECHLTKDAKAKPMVMLKIGIYQWPSLTTKTCENCHASPHTKQFSKQLLQKKCTECHITDDWLTMKNAKGFDHTKTRFPLTGSHKSTKCVDCHGEAGKQVFKFKSFDQQFCTDCHSGNIHAKQMSQKFLQAKCTDCHTTEKFASRKDFDHNTTAYALKGAHEKLECLKCHTQSNVNYTVKRPNVSFKEFPKGKTVILSKLLFPELKQKNCLACHADIHKGQVGNDCLKCHTQSEWKIAKFDHTKLTNFPLLEKHAQVKCLECHKSNAKDFVVEAGKKVTFVKYKPLPQQCLDCHKDVHNGNFGKSCQECHSERGWTVTRDFHKFFTLTGVHYSLECAECHRDNRKLAGQSSQCLTCHQKDDVHSGTLPNCKECHKQQFWETTSFRHSMTTFPLRGAHRTLDCLDCHTRGVYQGLSNQCYSCHLNDALAATSRTHTASETSCTDCHRNQFSFK